MRPKQLIHALTDLDKKAEELDRILQDVRVAIHNALWDLIELRKDRDKEKGKFKNIT